MEPIDNQTSKALNDVISSFYNLLNLDGKSCKVWISNLQGRLKVVIN